MVLTNIFRDQLDRYGEIDLIRKAIGKAYRPLVRAPSRLLTPTILPDRD